MAFIEDRDVTSSIIHRNIVEDTFHPFAIIAANAHYNLYTYVALESRQNCIGVIGTEYTVFRFYYTTLTLSLTKSGTI